MPTPMDFTDAWKEAVAAVDSNIIHYDTLTITSSKNADSLMLVCSNKDLSTSQGVYVSCDFDFRPPETEGGTVGSMEIEIKFLPKAARLWIMDQSSSGAQLSVVWRQYIGADIDPDFECRTPFFINKVDRTPGGVLATATLPDFLAMPFCRRIMTREELPGMAL